MSPTEQLRAYLSQHYVRVMDLLRSWDEDGNGVIDRQEFRQALPALGLSLDRQMIDELYDTFDADGSGLIDIDEMYEQLRHGAGIELDESLRVGANGEIETTRANKIALRQGLSGTHSTLVGMSALDANSDVPVVQQIQSALTRNFGRVIDVFHEWDEDGSGTIDRREFRRALPLLGIHLDKQTADALFDSFDIDGDGELDFRELHKRLKGSAQVIDRRPVRRWGEEAIDLPTAERAVGAATRSALSGLKQAEAEARQAKARVQRQLQRLSSQSAIATSRMQKRQVVLEVKADIDQRVGRDLSTKFSHVAPAPDADVQALSEMLNVRLATLPDLAKGRQLDWYTLFKHMDEDESGRICYDELARAIRSVLRLDKGSLPDARLQAMWVALDEDSSGFISAGEFGRFMRRGEAEGEIARTRAAKQRAQRRAAHGKDEQRREYEQLVGLDLNAKLAHVTPATEVEVNEAAALLCGRFAALPTMRSLGGCWFRFFNRMDEDGTGRIAYHELAGALRVLLRLDKATLPEVRLQALWRALDDDRSGFISVGEFIRFVKRGELKPAESVAERRLTARTPQRKKAHIEEVEWSRAATRKAELMTQTIREETKRLEALLLKKSRSLPKLDAQRSFVTQAGVPEWS
eukprot:Transcript_25495.p1 GENE.Transcript_25495~~Transcript_25495.p1  ORF type:complete len:636 (+),score=211.77 Transcript_25495:3-1910(+)